MKIFYIYTNSYLTSKYLVIAITGGRDAAMCKKWCAVFWRLWWNGKEMGCF